jgi:U3 small nucleolar RNA-associated protein 20
MLIRAEQDDESHFRVALDDWKQSNLSPTFLKFASNTEPLAMSMALLLHNAPDLVSLWMEAVGEADDEALPPLLE